MRHVRIWPIERNGLLKQTVGKLAGPVYTRIVPVCRNVLSSSDMSEPRGRQFSSDRDIHEGTLSDVPNHTHTGLLRFMWSKPPIHRVRGAKFSRNQRKRKPKQRQRPPLLALIYWLGGSSKTTQYQENGYQVPSSQKLTAPEVLLRYLQMSASLKTNDALLQTANQRRRVQKASLRLHSRIFDQDVLISLKRLGYSPDEIMTWSQILLERNVNVATQKLIRSNQGVPPFVLYLLLQHSFIPEASFKHIMIYLWGCLTNNEIRETPSYKIIDTELQQSHEDWDEKERASAAVKIPGTLRWPIEYDMFVKLILRLLRHARKVWPAALRSICTMIPIYLNQHLKIKPDSNEATTAKIQLPTQHHTRYNKLFNDLIIEVSLPVWPNPFKSMIYNWQAQQYLLSQADNFEPSLILDQNSYRAVANVLLALRKNSQETRYAQSMKRSWPPWREERDGMDAARDIKDDMSRVVGVISQMRSAGYSEESVDHALSILGGREPDGTPTIQTRTIIKPFSRAEQELALQRPYDEDKWAARITATRDVQEAWAAFQAFTDTGQKPTEALYHAIFEKLHYDNIRKLRQVGNSSSPGDSKEPLPVYDDNLSKSQKSRLQPPSTEDLYHRMIEEGVRPSTRFLALLIDHASDLNTAYDYMRKSNLDPNCVEILQARVGYRSYNGLARIPPFVFTAFLRLLGRLQQYGDFRRFFSLSAPDGYSLHPEGSKALYLHHMIDLVKSRRSKNRPDWYMIYLLLYKMMRYARRDGFLGRATIARSWELMENLLYDFHSLGLVLDPHGFILICNGLEVTLSYMPSHTDLSFQERSLGIIKNEFSKLASMGEGSASKDAAGHYDFTLPQHLYNLEGVHLHAYIRVLVVANALDSVVTTLKWMVRHENHLTITALEARNGIKQLRNTFVAIRVYLDTREDIEDVKASIKLLMEQVEAEWGGWPSTEEVTRYEKPWIHI